VTAQLLVNFCVGRTAPYFGAKGRARSGAQHRRIPWPAICDLGLPRFSLSRDSRRLRLRMPSLTSSRSIRLPRQQARRPLPLQRGARANRARPLPASAGSPLRRPPQMLVPAEETGCVGEEACLSSRREAERHGSGRRQARAAAAEGCRGSAEDYPRWPKAQSLQRWIGSSIHRHCLSGQ
jgi:hypothetical protein